MCPLAAAIHKNLSRSIRKVSTTVCVLLLLYMGALYYCICALFLLLYALLYLGNDAAAAQLRAAS